MIGELNTNASAAKLPVAATTTSACDGDCLRASLTVATPSPPPRAISGPSGPSTSPMPIERQAGQNDPGQRDRLREPTTDLQTLGRYVATVSR
jgi:hypothetical protein